MSRIPKRIALTVSIVAASLSGWGQESPDFNGRWELNRDESDDAQAKMREMRQKMMAERGGGRRGGMGGGGRRGGMAGGGGEGMRGGGGMTGPAMSQPEVLDITLADQEFHVDDGQAVAIFYIDGEEHKRQSEDGRSIKTTASHTGNSVVVEEERETGRMTIESTRTLRAVTRWERR